MANYARLMSILPLARSTQKGHHAPMDRDRTTQRAVRGSLAWGARRQGVLTAGERVRLAVDAVRAQLRASRSRELRRLGSAALEELRWPDTPLVAVARRLAAQGSPPWLLAHVERTFVWSALLARHGGLRPEPELLCCGALLHDLGLTALAAPRPEGGCFAVSGAQAAVDSLRTAGAPDDFAQRVGDAICLHLQPAVPQRLGLEAHLLQRGTMLDVLGSGKRALSAELVEAVLAQRPREGLPEALAATVRAEAARAPRTRLGLYVRRFGFAERVASARWDSQQEA